jgi:uncharacterized CHY-type Zn-finger protein
MAKSEMMEQILDQLSMSAFGRSRSESIKSKVCVDCGKPATEFEDALSSKEYQISGLCQQCQNEIFHGGAL